MQGGRVVCYVDRSVTKVNCLSSKVQAMASEIASPNGVFKRLDLEEKELVSPTEINTTNLPSGMDAFLRLT